MKKIVSCFLLLTLLLGMAACTAKPSGNEDTQPLVGGEETAIPESNPDECIMQVPSKEIYFYCPEGWTFSKETYSTVLMEDDECLVAVCYNWAVPYEGDLEGLVDFFSPGVMRDVAPYSKGYLGAAVISATTKEKSTVPRL